MAYEDLTTWTEADPNSRRTVTSSKVVVYRALRGDSGGRIYHDVGNGKINSFDIDFEYTPKENSLITGSVNAFFCICNELGDILDFVEDSVQLRHYNFNSHARIHLTDGANEDYSTDLSNDTKYYLTVSRAENGTTIYCYVYSDSDRNNLVDTVSLPVSSDVTYRYLSISNDIDYETSESYYGSYDVENVDIGDLDTVNMVASLMW